jgi:hypothetical protein
VTAIIVSLVVFAAVGAAVWVLRASDSNSPSSATSPPGSATKAAGGTSAPGVPAEVVSVAGLRQRADGATHPVFWAGPRAGARIEFTQTTDGSTYVRYLTGSAEAGDKRPDYVVVATYPQPDAYDRATTTARGRGYRIWTLPTGGAAIAPSGASKNVYVVYPDKPYQIEVYAPTASEARRLVFTDAIVPVV